jgi:hypothetical protein
MKRKLIGATPALLMTSGAAMTAEKQQSLKVKYLEDLALAMAIHTRCPTWTIDANAASEIMNFLKITIADVSPEGKDWPVMENYLTQMQDIEEEVACKMTAAGYGPNGVVLPKMMIKKD